MHGDYQAFFNNQLKEITKKPTAARHFLDQKSKKTHGGH
jgi:hypothetical protein